jgi:hypothetical protein
MFSMYTVRSLHADTAEDTAAIDALVGAPDSKDLQISTLLSIVKVLRAELQKCPNSSTSAEDSLQEENKRFSLQKRK